MKITTIKYNLFEKKVFDIVRIYLNWKNFLKEIEYIEKQDFKKVYENKNYFTFIIDKNV